MDNKIKRTSLNSTWFANVARSLGASADDIITDLAPTSREFVSTNANFLRSSANSMRGASGTVKGNARDFVKNNPFVGYGRDAVKNALADIKSGNINNVDREMEAAVGDGFMDLDLGFDDEPSSKNSSPKVVDRETPTNMKPTITAIEKGNRLTNNTLQQSIAVSKQNTKQMVDSGKSNTNMIVKATNQFASDSVSALNNMDRNIEKMVQFQSDTMSKYVGASIKYYDESLKSMNDTLKQMRDFLNPASGAQGDAKTSAYDKALTVNGALDMGGYASVIKSNINAAIDSNPVLQTIKMIVSDEGTLKSMVANPLASVSKAIVTKVLPAFLQETMKSFDKSLSSFFPAMLMKITRMSENSNPFLRALGDVFGVKSTTRKSVDVTQWNKGSIPFDSETKKSIVEVIPGYLRKMLAALDGKQEISFDYKSGTWKKVSDIKDDFKRQREYELLNPFQDFKEEISTLTNAVRVSQQERERFEKNIDKFFLRLADSGYGANVKDRESLNKIYDFEGSQSMQKMFQNALLSMSKSDQMKLMGTSIYEARKNENRFIEDAQNNLLSSNASTVFNQLSNDDNFKKGSNGKLVAKKGSVFNPVDKFGYNQLDYLQQIKKILIDGVRVFTAPVKNTGGSNVSTIMPEEDPILKRIRKQQEEEEKIAAIERKRRQEEEKKSSVRVSQKDRNRMLARGQIVSDGGYGDLDSMSDDALRQIMKNYKNNLEPVKEEKEKGGGFGTFLLKLISGKGDKSRGELAREKAKTIIEKPAQLVKGMLEKVDALMYDMVFGDPAKDQKKSIIGRISDGIKDTFSSVGNFIKDKVFSPIKEAIVGEKGIINQIKNHELFQTGNKNMQKMINGLFGEKVDGRRSGGMLGVFGDQILDSGSYMKYMISGKKYTDRQGKTHDDNPDAFVPTLAGVFKSGASSVKKYLFGDKDAKDDVNKRGVATMALDTIKTGLNNWSNALFGKEVIKGDKKINPKQIWTSMKTKMPKALAKGVVGAAAGTLLASGTGLLGAVFLPGATAALLGGAIGMSTESNGFMKTVFGDKNERGERMGGIVSKQTQDFFSKNKNVIIGGGALGLMKGALGFGLLPAIFGGPVAGAALGVAGAMIYRSNKVQDMLFGKMDNKTGEKIGGLFNKVRDMKTKGGQKFKDLLPNSVVGVLGGAAGATALGAIGSQFGLLGAMLTPVGPVGGAILGLAGGIAMSNKKFNRMLFGEFDEKTGKKEGGALTKLSNFFNLQIASPFKIEMKQIGLNMKKWFIGSIANPFKDALAPIKAAINNMVTSTSNMFKAGWGAVQGTISKVFEDSVGKPFGEFMRNSVGEPLLNFVKKTLKGAIYGPSKLIGGIISAPFRAMGFAGRRIEKRHKRKGVKAMRRNTWKTLGDTTGRAVREERLTLKGLYNKQGEKIDEGLFGQLKRAYFDKEAKEAAKVSAQGAYYAPEEDRRKAERDRTQKDMFDAAQAKIDEQRDRLAKARKLGRKADYDNFLNIKRADGTENKIDVSRFYNLSSMGRGQRQFLKENEYAAKEYSSNFKDLLGLSVQELLGDSNADVGNLTKGQRKTLQRAMKSGYTGNALRRHMGIKIETAEEAEEKKNAVIKTTASKAMATMPDVIKDTMKLSDDKRGNQLKEHAVAIVKGITGVFRNKSEQEIMQDMDAKRIVGRRKKNTNSTSNNRESSDDGESAQSSSDGSLDDEDSKISKIVSPVKGIDKKSSHMVNLLRSVWTKAKPLPVVVVSGKVKPTGDGGSGPNGGGPSGPSGGGGGGGVDSPGAGTSATLTGTFNRTKSATKSSIRGIQNLNEFRKLYKSGTGGVISKTKSAIVGVKEGGGASVSAPRNTRSLSGATRSTPSVLKNGSIRSANVVGGFRRNDPAVYGGNTPEFASRRNVSHILGEKAEQQEIIERSIFRSTTVDNLTQIEYNTRTTWKLLEGLQASLGKMKDGFADLIKPLNRIADGITQLPEVMSDLNQNVLEKMNEILDAMEQNADDAGGGEGGDYGGAGSGGGGSKTTPIIGKGGRGNGGRRQNTYVDKDRYNIIVNVAGLGSGSNGGNSTTTSKNKGKGDKTPPPVPPTTPQTVVVSNTGSGGMMMMPPMTSMSRGQTVSKQPLGGPSVNIPIGPSVGKPMPNTASKPTYTGTGTYRSGQSGYNNTKPVPTRIGGKNVAYIPRGGKSVRGGGFFQPGSGALGLASGLMAVTPAGRGGGMLKDIALFTGINYGINQVMNSGQDAVSYVDENGQVVTENAVDQGKSVMDQTGAQISQTSGDLAKFYKWDAESREKANMPDQTPFKESELYKSLSGTWDAVAKTFKIPESVDYINEASNKIIDTLNGVISQTGNNLMNAWESIKNNDFGGALGDLTQGGAAKALLAGGAAALGYAGYRAFKNHRTRIRLKHQDLAHRDMNDLNKTGKGTLTQIKEAERRRTMGEFAKDTLTTRHFTKSGRAQLRKEKDYRNERREMARKDHDTYMRDWRTGDVSALESKYERVNKYDRNGNLRKDLMGDPNRTPEGSYYKGRAYDGNRVGDITDARFESGSRLDDMINRAKHPIQYADYVHEQNQRGKHVYNRDGGEPFRKKRTLMGKIAIGGAVTAGTLALGPAALPVAAAGGAGLFGYRKWKDRKKDKNNPTPTPTGNDVSRNQPTTGHSSQDANHQQPTPVNNSTGDKQGKDNVSHDRGMIVKGHSSTNFNDNTFVYDRNNPKSGGRVVSKGNLMTVDFGQYNGNKTSKSNGSVVSIEDLTKNSTNSKVVPIKEVVGPSVNGELNRYRTPIGPNMGNLVQFPGGGTSSTQGSTMSRVERRAKEKQQAEYKPIKGSFFRHPMSVEEQIAEDKRLEEKKRKNAQINAEADAISSKRDKEWAERKEQHKAIVAEEKAQKQAAKDKAKEAKRRKGNKASRVRDENYADYNKAWDIANAENESNRQKKKREKRVEKFGKMRAMVTAGKVRDQNYADYNKAWDDATAADRAKKESDRQNKKDYSTRSAQVRDENYADYKKAWAEATAPEREAKEAKRRAKEAYSARSAQVRDENYADYKREWGKVNDELDRQKRVKTFTKQRETIKYSGRTRAGRMRDELAMPKSERQRLEQELAEKGRIHNESLKANEEKERNRLRQYNTDRIEREVEVEKRGERTRGTLGDLRQQRADNKHYILNGSYPDRSTPIPKGYISRGSYTPQSPERYNEQRAQVEEPRNAKPSKKSLLGRALKGGDSNRQGIVAGDTQLRKDVAAAGKEMRQNIKSAAKSLSGSLSSAGKTVSNSIKGGAKSASASLTKAGASTTKAFASGSKSIMSAGMSVSKAGGTVAKSLSTAANPLVKAASSLGSTMSKSKSTFDSFFSRLRKARVGGAGAAGGMNDFDMMGGKGGKGGKKGGLFGKLGGGLARGGMGLAKGLGKNALKTGLSVIPGLGLAAGASMGWADGRSRVDDIFNIKEGEKASKEQTKAAGIGGAIVGSIPFADMIDQAFGGKITKFFADLAFDFDKKFDEIKGWFGKKMDTVNGWIGEKVGPIWDKVKEPFVTIYDTVNEKYQNAKDFVVRTTLKTYNAIAKPVKAIWNKSKEIWDKVSSTVKKVFSSTLKVITAPARAVLSVSKKVWDKVSSSVKSAFTKTYNAVSKPVKAVLSTAKSVWNKVSSSVSSGFGKVKDKITTVVTKVYDTAKDKFDGAKKAVSDKFTAMKDKISKVVGDIWDKTKDKFDGAKKAVVDKFTDFKDGIGEKVDKIVTAISDPIGAVKDMVTDKFNAVKRRIESFFSEKEEEYAGGKTNAGKSNVTNNFYYGGGTTNISKVRKNTNHVYGAGNADVDKDGDVYYSQKDSRWAGQSLAGGGGLSFGDAGCGPTAASMLISSVNNNSSYGSGNAVYGAGITWGGGKTLARSYGMGRKPKAQPKPTDALRFAQSGGYVDPNLGTRSDFFNMYSAANGIATRNQENPTGSDIRNELAAGNKMVLRGVGGRNYTSSGHYIVATGLTADGKVKVKDPLSKSRSGEFDADSLAQNATTAIIAQGKQPKDHGAGIIKQRAQFFGAGNGGMEPHQYDLYDENDTTEDPSVDEMGDYVGDVGLPAPPVDVSPLVLSMNVAEYGDPLSPDYLSEDTEDGMGYGAGKSSKKKKVPASKFINAAKKYMGWKYVWGGSNPKTSFDCSGLVQYSLKTIGISMTRTSRQQYGSTKRIKAKHARVGDLVFFSNKSRWRGNPLTDITHVGIVDKDGYMINAAGGDYYGKVVRHKIQGTHPAAYIVAYGRVPGIEPGELSKGLKAVWGDKLAPKNDPYGDQKVSKSKKGKSSGKTSSSKIGTTYKTIKEKVFAVKDPFEQFRLGLDLALRSKLMNKKVSYNQFKDLLYNTVEKQVKVQGTKIRSSSKKSSKSSKDAKLNGKGFKNTKAYSGRFGKSPLTLAGSVKGKEDHVKNIIGEEIAKSEGGGYFYGAKYGINYKKQRISPDMGIFHWRESTAVSTVNKIIKEAKKKLPYQSKFSKLGTWKKFWNDGDLSQWRKFLNADKTATIVGQNKSASAKIDENMRQIDSRVGKNRMPTKPHQYVALADIINTGNHLSKMRSVRNVSDPTMASAIQSAWLGRKIYYDRAMRVMNATRNIKWKKDSQYGAGNIKGAVWGAGRSRVNYRPGTQSNLRRAMYSGSRGSVYGAGFAHAPKARPSGFSFGLGKGKASSSRSSASALPYTVIRNAPNSMMVTPPGMMTYGRHDNHKGSIRVNSFRPVMTNIKTWGSGFGQSASSFTRPAVINRYISQPPVIMGMGQEPQDPSLMMQMVELLTQIVDNTFAISENTKYISVPTEDGGRTEVPVVVQGGQPQQSGGQGMGNGLAQAMAISRGRMN